MRKVVYIIPGFRENFSQKGYRQVRKLFTIKGYHVIQVTITWNHSTMSDYVNEFLKQLRHKQGDKVTCFGFSFGAMIAFISASKVRPYRLYLCSLSPYFKEDLKFLRSSWRYFFGKRRINDFDNFSFDKLAKQAKCQTILVCGSKEGKELSRRVTDANRKIANSQLYIAQKAGHDMSQKEYLNKLHELIH